MNRFFSLLMFSFLLLVLFLPFGCNDQPTNEKQAVEKNEALPDASQEKTLPEKELVQKEQTKEVQREAPKESTPTKKAPNILLIIADDLGMDAFAPYHDKDGDGKADDGRTYPSIPNITQVCKQGIRFQKFWATPLCSSTRASILTGRYGFRTGIGGALEKKQGIKKNELTLPKLLSADGNSNYVHANIGKWHLGTTTALQKELAPNTMGWLFYAGSLSGGLPDYSKWDKTVNGKTSPSTTYATTENVNDAIGWLSKQEKDKPWLLWLAFNAPHTPFHLPPKELHSQDKLTGTQQDLRNNPAPYFRAMVEAMDTEIGRLFSYLKKQGTYDNTLIIFLGDNGTPSRVVEPPYDRSRSKDTLYEGGIHVPMCITGPMVAKKQSKSDALINSVDLFATIAEAAGIDKKVLSSKDTIDSVSFLSHLEGKNQGERTWLFSERFISDGSRNDKAIRNQRYKILQVLAQDKKSFQIAFFDLEKDPFEKKNLLEPNGVSNLSSEEKKAYDELKQQLDKLGKK